ncbi:hypothetical protein [Porticoccus sp.]|uniref:hypothetical protein n=1 Tax=Porticoccus sp. TaxID=2024853 RepID=UPI003F6950A0
MFNPFFSITTMLFGHFSTVLLVRSEGEIYRQFLKCDHYCGQPDTNLFRVVGDRGGKGILLD